MVRQSGGTHERVGGEQHGEVSLLRKGRRRCVGSSLGGRAGMVECRKSRQSERRERPDWTAGERE